MGPSTVKVIFNDFVGSSVHRLKKGTVIPPTQVRHQLTLSNRKAAVSTLQQPSTDPLNAFCFFLLLSFATISLFLFKAECAHTHAHSTRFSGLPSGSAGSVVCAVTRPLNRSLLPIKCVFLLLLLLSYSGFLSTPPDPLSLPMHSHPPHLLPTLRSSLGWL